MRKTIFCILFYSLALCYYTDAQNGNDRYDVPYVPTDMIVVERMLQMANVNENDILYDLGCGDGRIVITAAKKYGARGVGIDINPIRIEESNDNAEMEGVTDRVRFIKQDLFTIDFSEATVLTMYLLPSVNIKLRPKIFQLLRPGTRIVSHDFDMGDWDEDQSVVLEGEFDNFDSFDTHTVYFWTLPANVSGSWEWNLQDRICTKYVLTIEQEFQKLLGKLTVGKSGAILKNVTIHGDTLSFVADYNIDSTLVTSTYLGIVDGNSISGAVVTKTGISSGESTWKAVRNPFTVVPLDVFSSE